MAVKEIGDPRLQALFGTSDPRDSGVRPTVRLPGKGLPPIAIAIMFGVFALVLFVALDGRRTRQVEPQVRTAPGGSPDAEWNAPPPLYIPPVPQPYPPSIVSPTQAPASVPGPAPVPVPVTGPASRTVAVAPVASPVAQAAPSPMPTPTPGTFSPPPLPAPRVSSGSALVLDNGGAQDRGAAKPGEDGEATAEEGITRMRASALANRSMTVPQGYLIPAVLETGFDSTKPGFARALVSRDVRGFDGKNVLIPRGSRLVGRYQASVAQGQSRAVITWTRLIRPDGMTITMDSPATDTMGRGGVAASVNSHFFARLGDALLQTTFSLGQLLSGRAVTGPVVVLQGNAAAAATQAIAPHAGYEPTLRVPPGRSISVFVAHDLDFSGAGGAR